MEFQGGFGLGSVSCVDCWPFFLSSSQYWSSEPCVSSCCPHLIASGAFFFSTWCSKTFTRFVSSFLFFFCFNIYFTLTGGVFLSRAPTSYSFRGREFHDAATTLCITLFALSTHFLHHLKLLRDATTSDPAFVSYADCFIFLFFNLLFPLLHHVRFLALGSSPRKKWKIDVKKRKNRALHKPKAIK